MDPLGTPSINDHDQGRKKMRISPYLAKPLYYAQDCISKGVQKIKSCVKGIFDWIASIKRYCGSKTNVGWKREFGKAMTREKAIEMLPYVGLVAYVHSCHDTWSAPFGWSPISPESFCLHYPNVVGNDHCFLNQSSGLKVSLLERGNEVAVVFGAVGSLKGENKGKKNCLTSLYSPQAHNTVSNLSGIIPQLHLEAEGFVDTLLSHPRLYGKKVVFVGQCSAGSIASYVALKRGEKAICFNSLQLGAGLQYRIGTERLKKADQFVTHVSVAGDFLSYGKVTNTFDRALSFLGIRTPGNFGEKYELPSAYTSQMDTHEYVNGSFMQFLGYSQRDKPTDKVIHDLYGDPNRAAESA